MDLSEAKEAVKRAFILLPRRRMFTRNEIAIILRLSGADAYGDLIEQLINEAWLIPTRYDDDHYTMPGIM